MSIETISPGGLVTKPAAAQRIYQFDWTDYLSALGDTIATSSFAISGRDTLLVYDNDGIVNANLKTQLRLKAGTPGRRYKVSNRIVGANAPANTEEVFFWLQVER
jgi:hypothetical protein